MLQHALPHRIALAIINDYMESGYLKAGDRMPTVRELEKQYRVSRNTIVHALSLLEQQGYVTRKHGSGVYITEPSSSRHVAEPLIGLVGPNVQAELVFRVYEGVEHISRQHGIHVVVASTGNCYETEKWQIERLVQLGCQAIILFPCTRTQTQLQRDYLKNEFKDVPIVLVDTAYPEQMRPQVVFDNYRAGFEMTEMLIRDGHEHIAFMDFARREDNWVHYSTRERYRGYIDALRSAGLTPHPSHRWVIWDKHFALDDVRPEIAAFLHNWLVSDYRPTAVIAIEDATAAQTILLAQEMGIRVPEQLYVVGFDNLPAARMFRPAFPTTSPDFRRAGEIAAGVAMQMIQSKVPSSLVYMLPAPILRRGALLSRAQSRVERVS